MLTPELLTNAHRQMSPGEQAAVEGVLSQLKPSLSLQTGNVDADDVARIAAHSTAVHAFDLEQSTLTAEDPSLTLHSGNSRDVLPLELKRFSEAGQNVEFVLIGRQNSAAGIRCHVEDLLNSPALGKTTILIHETTNGTVRDDLDAVHFAAWPKVQHVDLDFIPGRMFRDGKQLGGGLGLVTVDSSRLAYTNGSIADQRCYSAAHLFADARRLIRERDLEASSDRERGSDELLSAGAYESSMDKS